MSFLHMVSKYMSSDVITIMVFHGFLWLYCWLFYGPNGFCFSMALVF